MKFKSISKELLKIVFAFYFSITIVITGIHFMLEYYATKDAIKQELKDSIKTFYLPLSQSLWNFDNTQTQSIIKGIMELPMIIGVKIYDKNNNETLFETYSKSIQNSQEGSFSITKDLYYNFKGKKIYVGSVEFFSSSKVIFNRVKIGFLLILINATIKSLILTILFIWAFNKYLTIPLNRIRKNIEQVDLEKIENQRKIPIIKKNNELGILSKAFNKMIDNLKAKYQQLLQTQDRLIKSEKMVALGEMVAGVAHEINTPVGMALTGITHLDEETKKLKKLYENEEMSEEDFEEFLNNALELNRTIEINLNKAANLVRSFKKVSVDQSSDEKRTFNMCEYIDEILLSLINKLKRTKIKVNIDCQRDLTITSKPGHFSQILTNFINNSLLHGFDKDQSGNIHIIARQDDKFLYLIYKDDGKGLSEDVKRKIFNPFFTTKRGQGGSGLGMSIVYNIVVNSLNGEINIKSEEGHGVEFDIKIPLKG